MATIVVRKAHYRRVRPKGRSVKMVRVKRSRYLRK